MCYLVESYILLVKCCSGEYMPTDLIKLTFEDVLFKMSYSVYTLSRYLDYLNTKDDTHLKILHVATSECVKISQTIHNKLVYCSSNLEWNLTSMTVPNVRYCESHLLYRVY